MQIRGSKGQMVNAEQLDFKLVNDGYSEYKLSDGKILKLRVVLAEVYRLDEIDEMTGKNNYFIKSAPIVSVEEPPKK
jgi:hypothetical protein